MKWKSKMRSLNLRKISTGNKKRFQVKWVRMGKNVVSEHINR